MVDRGPLLTSAIIFYLSIGAAIFEVLEHPHLQNAAEGYKQKKSELLKEFPCLGQEGLDKILRVSLKKRLLSRHLFRLEQNGLSSFQKCIAVDSQRAPANAVSLSKWHLQ